jgi:glycosyltransferase involved in cell wall biosynthesis
MRRTLPPRAEPSEAAVRTFLGEYGAGRGAPLAVVIAAYNEEGSVGGVIESLPGTVSGSELDVLVVDDGSEDATAERAAAAGALVCRLAQNLGQGRALRVGYRLAAARGARIVVTMDADGQFDPSELSRLVEPVLAGTADFVNGSRRLGRSENRDVVRRAGVRLFGAGVSAPAGTRITDPANGFRAFRTEVATSVPQEQPQYQTAELLIGAVRSGFRVLEVPVTVRPRAAGVSKKGGNLLYGYRFGRAALATWWRHRRTNRAPGRSGTPATPLDPSR